MPIKNTFKTCTHNTQPQTTDPATSETRTEPGGYLLDWRNCFQCIDEVTMQLIIARAYLREIAEAEFNANDVCVKPVSEPVYGRDRQQIAATGLGAASD